jgi:hypothetical protein
MTNSVPAALLMILVASCGASGASTREAEASVGRRFALYFFEAPRVSAYDYDSLWSAVEDLDRSTALFVLRDEDVQAYEVGQWPSTCVTLRIASEAARQLAAVQDRLLESPILATLDASPLYGATEYARHGAAAIQRPVVHLDRLSEREVSICGALLAIAGRDDAERIDRMELREHFHARGVLRLSP